jgi:hypothetical protein
MLQGLDYVRYYELNASWLRLTALAGEIPWWNPHVGLGRPFLADLQTGVFYPPHGLHVLLGVPVATVLLMWIHLIWAGYGMFRLARIAGCTPPVSWLTAAILIVSPALCARAMAGQIHYVMALCYLPGMVWLLVRVLQCSSGAGWAALAVVSAGQLLCGHPQVYWLTGLGLGIFALAWSADLGWRRIGLTLARLAGSLGLGLALTAPVLLPFLELAGESNRAEFAVELSRYGALTPSDWLALVWPPTAKFVPDIEGLILVGAPVVIAALGAIWSGWRTDRMVRALAMLALTATILASALPSWLHQMVEAGIPGFAAFRMPARIAILVVLALLVLAGRWASRPQRSRLVIALGLTVTGITLAAALPAMRQWYVLPTDYPTEPAVAGLVRELQADDPARVPPRFNFTTRLIRENSGMLTGHSSFNAYGSLYLQRVWTYIHAAAGLPEPGLVNSFPDVRIFERDPFFSRAMNIVAGYDTRTREVRLNADPDPRAYLCFTTQPLADWGEAVTKMVSGHKFHQTALVERDIFPWPAPSEETHGKVTITAFANERVTLRTEASAPAVLVLAEAWWKATVNGVPAEGFPVNGWMRGVVVPAGSATVDWHYRQRWVGLGAGLALAAGFGLVCLIMPWRRKGPSV